jgi:hypothetical protein
VRPNPKGTPVGGAKLVACFQCRGPAKFSMRTRSNFSTVGGGSCDLRGICATFFVLFCFVLILYHFFLLQGLQACRREPVLIAGTGRCYRSTAVYTAVLQYLYYQYYYYAVQHVSQAPPGRAKCPADHHARRQPKREAEGREPAAAGATTDHTPHATRQLHPATGTSNKLQ